MSEYPLTGKKHPRRFQSHWFKSYPWLEYSEKNTAFCFPCYLFSSKSSGSQDQTPLLLKDSIVGRKLMMKNNVFFYLIWENVQIQLINLLPSA